jgi:oligopeptide transport system substrate-binding protein
MKYYCNNVCIYFRRKKMKRNLVRLSLALLLSFVLVTGFAFAGGGRQSAQGHGQKLTYPLASLPTIDPQKFNAAPSYGVIKGYSEGLIQFHQGKVTPGVAERWEIAPDNKKMTFHLRRDAKWSDGTPLTANDFLYAFRRLADPKNNCDYRWVLDEIVNGDEIPYGDGSIPVERLGVSAPDNYTFVIDFRVPAPYYLGFLDMPPFHPVKKEVVERYGDQYAMDASRVLGNGPFIIKEYLFEQKITFVPNPNYWNKSAVKLEEVTVVIMSREAGFTAFQNGEVDFVAIPIEIGPEYVKNPRLLPNADVSTYMSGAVDWYCINIASQTNRILANKDFRLALNYALDRQQCVDITSGGLYQPASRFVLPGVSGARGRYTDEYPINLYKSTAEIDKARQHLNAAMTALGISNPNQINIAIKVADTTPRLIAENCQDQWQKALGIRVTIDIVTYRAMLSDRVAGNFDLVYAGWMPDFDDPYTYLGYFTSSNSQNGGKFSNPRYDELVTTANNYTDPARRLSMYAEAEKILLEEAGIIPLQVRQVPDAKIKNLKGFSRFYLGAEEDWIYAYFE